MKRTRRTSKGVGSTTKTPKTNSNPTFSSSSSSSTASAVTNSSSISKTTNIATRAAYDPDDDMTLGDISTESLLDDGALVDVDLIEQAERTDITSAVFGSEEINEGKSNEVGDAKASTNESTFDPDVMFMKVVRRRKQPETITPLPEDMESPPTIDQITAAGLNPGGYTSTFFKIKLDKATGQKHFQLPTGLRIAPRTESGKFEFEQKILDGPETETFSFQYGDKVELNQSTFDGRPLRHRMPESTGTGNKKVPGEKDTKDLLDVTMLEEYGMCKERRRDFFFFVLLLLPLADFEFSNDLMLHGFWLKLATFTATYEVDIPPYGIGGVNKTRFKARDTKSIINFLGIAIHNGVLGGRSISQRYKKCIEIPDGVCPIPGSCVGCPNGSMINPLFSPFIQQAMNEDEFKYTRRVLKANNNRDPTATRGHPTYSPSHKYDLPWDAARDNTITLTMEGTASLIVVMDENTSSNLHKSGGETIKRIANKPGATKGTQENLVLGCEEDHKRLYHRLSRHGKQPRLLTYGGCNELA